MDVYSPRQAAQVQVRSFGKRGEKGISGLNQPEHDSQITRSATVRPAGSARPSNMLISIKVQINATAGPPLSGIEVLSHAVKNQELRACRSKANGTQYGQHGGKGGDEGVFVSATADPG